MILSQGNTGEIKYEVRSTKYEVFMLGATELRGRSWRKQSRDGEWRLIPCTRGVDVPLERGASEDRTGIVTDYGNFLGRCVARDSPRMASGTVATAGDVGHSRGRRVGWLACLRLMWVLCGITSLAAATEGRTNKAPMTLPGGWKLEWHDEFSGSKLNKKNWCYEEGVTRNRGCSQTYTKESVRVKDGMLRITAEAKETPNILYRPAATAWPQNVKTQGYASGSVTTRGMKTFAAPGRLEIRAKVPKAHGVWPAIWTMHENKYKWPTNGEIDILEHISQEPDKVYSIFRWGENGTTEEHKVIRTTDIPEYSGKFHDYVLEWDEERMRILIDGDEIGGVDIKEADYPDGGNPLRTPCYLIINLAIGGADAWAEPPTAEDYPVTFEVDYVRYYTKKVKKKKK